jgi:hypothetical protein
MENGKSTRDRVQAIAETVHRDENDCPVLNIEVRFYEGGHLFIRGYKQDGTVATAIGCRNLAEAVVLTGDITRRANAKAMKLLSQKAAGRTAVETRRRRGALREAARKAVETKGEAGPEGRGP